MSIEDRALSAFREANPIPDPDKLDPDHFAGYLAVIEQRSSEMIQTDKHTIEARPPRNRRPLAAAIAIAAVLAGIVAIGLLARNVDSEPDVADTPPPTVAETTPATTQPEAVAEPMEVSPETIVGYWGRSGFGVMAISADGTLRQAVAAPDTPIEEIDSVMEQSGLYTGGTWTLDGDVLTFTSDGGGQYCGVGEVATMTLTVQPGKLVVSNVTDSDCYPNEIFGQGRFPGIWSFHG